MVFDMHLLSISTVSLASGPFPVHFRLNRNQFCWFWIKWIYFSLFVTQLAMPTPFNVTNMDQKKPNRWAPLLNYWKVWFIIYHVSTASFFEWTCDTIFKKWTCEGINSFILYSFDRNFSTNWFIQENWLIEFICNSCWRICNE